MRMKMGGMVILSLLVSAARAEQVVMQLEWGFSPTSSELYWDGQVQVEGGEVLAMKAVSFEADRHDRMAPPRFKSFTIGGGTDGMELVVQGDDQTPIRLESRQGTFEWKIGELRRKREITFPASEGGRLVVRLLERLGDEPRCLSSGETQDSDPAICRLADGRRLLLWRAFSGLPTEDPKQAKGDQIGALLLERDGTPGHTFALLSRPGDIETIAVAPTIDGNAQVVWAERLNGNWDLFGTTVAASAAGVQCAEPERLTEDPGIDKSPALAVASDRSLVLAWQGWRGPRSGIYCQRFTQGEWHKPLCVSGDGANDWNPAIAASADGSVAVGWSRWRNGSYDVCLRVESSGAWGPEQLVAATDCFEAHPSLVFDRQGILWIAYEEGRAGWGMDSHTAGLRSKRNVRLRCVKARQVEIPLNTAALSFPEVFLDRSEMAHLATDGSGVLWLFFRSLSGRGVWNIFGSSLGENGWAPPRKLPKSAGGQDVSMAADPDADQRLRLLWASDHRINQVGLENKVYTSRMPPRPVRIAAVETEPVPGADPIASPKKPAPRPTYAVKGKQLGLYFGDLHRHTEVSVCRTGTDGSLEDAYRYAIDAAGLDFLCVTDHVQHQKILNDYDFWRSGKTADLHYVAGLHQPFYGYERSQRFPFGHRNIIGVSREVKRVPRTADNRAWSANSGYEGEERLPPPELWTRLLGENVVTIPHSSTSPVMGTDFASRPTAIEPVVEIYQGCRYTSEHAGAPDPRRQRDNTPYGGRTQPAGFIWNALAKGYRYGFIASSDHMATHNSYTCVWADEFTNEALLEAIAKRQCYAATEKITCRMCMGTHLMGSQFVAENVPPLQVDVEAPVEIDRVDVIKDNRVVFVRQPDRPTRRITFEFQDTQATPGIHYYYARVIQGDRNMAWISPIWVDVRPGK